MLTDIIGIFFLWKLWLEYSVCFEGTLNYWSILCYPHLIYLYGCMSVLRRVTDSDNFEIPGVITNNSVAVAKQKVSMLLLAAPWLRFAACYNFCALRVYDVIRN